ncbi:MAG TPA: hypothetical protein VIY48_10070 [Candidatus Paceibacterota bacterium]
MRYNTIKESTETSTRRTIVSEDVAFLMECGFSKKEAYQMVRTQDELDRWNNRLAR